MAVDNSAAWAPVPAVARPVRAGQLLAHWPLQADWSPLSLVKAYRVRPSASTRMSPNLLVATATVVPPAAWAAVVGAAVAAVPDPWSSLPPQAASARASAARSAAVTNVFLMDRPPELSAAPLSGGADHPPRWTTPGPGRWFPNPASYAAARTHRRPTPTRLGSVDEARP